MVDYTNLGNQPAGVQESFYYLQDILGSTVALTDTDGNVVERYFYEPYGTTIITDGDGSNTRTSSTYSNPIMWTGQRYDSNNNLYHFWARTYSPELGRWLQRDPLGYVDGMNLYEYVSSNPMTFLDSLGLEINWWNPFTWGNPTKSDDEWHGMMKKNRDMLLDKVKGDDLQARRDRAAINKIHDDAWLELQQIRVDAGIKKIETARDIAITVGSFGAANILLGKTGVLCGQRIILTFGKHKWMFGKGLLNRWRWLRFGWHGWKEKGGVQRWIFRLVFGPNGHKWHKHIYDFWPLGTMIKEIAGRRFLSHLLLALMALFAKGDSEDGIKAAIGATRRSPPTLRRPPGSWGIILAPAPPGTPDPC
jgi:RHS repeat-associated protein